MFCPKHPDTVKPEYKILGTHVRKLASCIAIGSIIMSIILIALSVFYKSWSNVVVNILVIVVSICVLLADKLEKPILYVPYLFYVVIIMIFPLLYILISVVFIFIDNKSFDKYPTVISESWIIDIIIVIILEVIGFFCWRIVNKARIYMVKEVVPRNVQTNTANGSDAPNDLSKV